MQKILDNIDAGVKEGFARARKNNKGMDCSVLYDAKKGSISMPGQALLQWGFSATTFACHSLQMPEAVVDQILKWRDEAYNRKDAHERSK